MRRLAGLLKAALDGNTTFARSRPFSADFAEPAAARNCGMRAPRLASIRLRLGGRSRRCCSLVSILLRSVRCIFASHRRSVTPVNTAGAASSNDRAYINATRGLSSGTLYVQCNLRPIAKEPLRFLPSFHDNEEDYRLHLHRTSIAP